MYKKFTLLLLLEILANSAFSLQSKNLNEKANLYIVSIGISASDLKYTTIDAEEVLDAFRTQEGKLFGSVVAELLICPEETERLNIATVFESLSSKNIRKQDVLLVFISGHGSIGTKGFGLVSTSILKGTSKNQSLLDYQTEVLASINGLPCKKIILLDACHSGQAASDQRKISEAINRTPQDVLVLVSSSADETSFESDSWKHGAFTNSLLKGLNGLADKSPKNSVVTFKELAAYVENDVPYTVATLLGKKQQPRKLNISQPDINLFNYNSKVVPKATNKPPCGKNQKGVAEKKSPLLSDEIDNNQHPGFVIKPVFDQVREFSEGLAAVNRLGRWGFVNRAGEQVIKTQYELVGDFSDGLAAVRIGAKWGFIDKAGTFVIQPLYLDADSFVNGIAPVKKGDYWGYIDKMEKVKIPFKFGEARPFSEGLAAISMIPMYWAPHSSIPPSGQWGYIDVSGKVVIETKYTDARSFRNGLAWVRLGSFGDFADTIDGFHYGYVNKSGREVIPIIYGNVSGFGEGLVGVKNDQVTAYIDTTKKVEINLGETVFDLDRFSEGLAAIKINYDQWGYINKAGDIVIADGYWTAGQFSEGLAFVTQMIGTRRFFINKRGQKLSVVPPEKIWAFKDGIAVAAIKDPITYNYKWGFYKHPLKNPK